jgi:hypothetical protein
MAKLTVRALTLLSTFSLLGCPTQPSADDAANPDAGELADAVVVDSPPPDPFPAHCENVNALECMAPWPSSRFLTADPSTRTGYRIDIPRAAMPTNRYRVQVDPAQFTRFDGFSPATSMLTVFAGPIDTSQLADEQHIPDSLAADSQTVLLIEDASGGFSRVEHFAEVDTWGDVDATRTPFYIRPATRLRPGAHYVVGIRNLERMGGGAVPPSDYFRALRDNMPLPEAADIEGRRAQFETIFGALTGAGVSRSELIEAWDFRTASDELITEDLVRIRDEAIRQNEGAGNCRITVAEVQEAPDADVWRRVRGTVRVPLFLNSTRTGGGSDGTPADARIRRNAMGQAIQNAETPFVEVPFTATIPTSVHTRLAAGGDPVRLLTYGHGLFGARDEVESGWFRNMTNVLEMASIAVDWWGMSSEDVGRVLRSLSDFSSFVATPERFEQGLINFVVLTHSFANPTCQVVSTDPNVFSIAPTAGGAARRIWDNDELYYGGESQGGIMGMTLAAISTDITHFMSGVSGMSYSIMIPRSSNWISYGAVMANSYQRQSDRALLMTMAQSVWDLSDPATFVGRITGNRLPCSLDSTTCPGGMTPDHRLVMMIGQNDAQVANITADIAARTLGIPVVTPSPYMPHGLATTAARPEDNVTSAMVIYDIPGTPVLPLGTRNPGGDNPAHEGVRRSVSGYRMLDRFYAPDGIIVNECMGTCNPD